MSFRSLARVSPVSVVLTRTLFIRIVSFVLGVVPKSSFNDSGKFVEVAIGAYLSIYSRVSLYI